MNSRRMDRIVVGAMTAAVSVLATVAIAATASGEPGSGSPNRTLSQAMAHGWDCNP